MRTLVLLMTLVCIWLACWLPTARNGRREVIAYVEIFADSPRRGHEIGSRTIENASAVFPFVVVVDQWQPTHSDPYAIQREYYFWFFGYVTRLPPA